MKTVTGKITSSTPVPILKVASIMTNFVSSADTGASQAIKAYLQRTTTAFDELVRLHSKSNRRKQKKHRPTQNLEAGLTHTNQRIKIEKREAVGSIVEGDLVGDKMGIVKEEDQKSRKKKRMK